VTDLAALILAAIDETEEAARFAATAGRGGDWELAEHPARWGELDSDEEILCGGKPILRLLAEHGGQLTSWHLQLHEPKRVLAACAADRRTVERHSRRGKSVLRNGEFEDYCVCGGPLGRCPDILDRADAYGVEVP
jgi:hypothetical protein